MKWKFQVAIVFILRVNVDCFSLGSIKVSLWVFRIKPWGTLLETENLEKYEHKPNFFKQKR